MSAMKQALMDQVAAVMAARGIPADDVDAIEAITREICEEVPTTSPIIAARRLIRAELVERGQVVGESRDDAVARFSEYVRTHIRRCDQYAGFVYCESPDHHTV